MFIQTKALSKVLTFSQIKYYIFSAVFAGLAVATPTIFHQFNLAGPRFLPMHIFVLIAGLLFGWRTGLLVGLLSPLMSYSLTHMPVMALLPQVTLELAAYGFVAGFLREKNLNIWASLAAAMIFGRLARLALSPDLSFIQMSWPGIILQLALIPAVVYLWRKIFKNF